MTLDPQHKAAIRALACDFPRVWNNSKTPPRERKRLVRLLIEDVTLIKADKISIQIRFKGGATQTLTLPRPQPAWRLRQTLPEVTKAIDHLLNYYTDQQVAAQLNEQGVCSGTGSRFNQRIIAKLRKAYGLKSRYDRLRDAGMLTGQEIAQQLDVSVDSVKVWRRAGRLSVHAFNEKGGYLYEPLGDHPPTKYAWQRSLKKKRTTSLTTDRTEEVQYEA